MKYPCYVIELNRPNRQKVDKILDADYDIKFFWDLTRGWQEWINVAPAESKNFKDAIGRGAWDITKIIDNEEELFTEIL
jgi:hypothetical protein